MVPGAVLFVCLVGFLTSSSTTRLYRGRAPRQERLTILRAATHETELGDHDFCLSRSHYTDTDPTCRERAATAGIEPGTSSPGVARSTAELPRPPCREQSPEFFADGIRQLVRRWQLCVDLDGDDVEKINMRCVAEVSSFDLMYNLCMYYEKQKSYDKTELTFQPTLVIILET